MGAVVGDTQRERLARNEAFFRDVNECIRGAGKPFGDGGAGDYDFFCECPDPACVERIALTPAEYEAVRADSRRFLIAPGHDVPAIEHVVSEGELVAVVEKDGAAGDVAESLDRRR